MLAGKMVSRQISAAAGSSDSASNLLVTEQLTRIVELSPGRQGPEIRQGHRDGQRQGLLRGQIRQNLVKTRCPCMNWAKA
ncbi:MAG: hypothetical protein ACLSUW_10455 [Akkermansia sp.]